MSEITDIEQDEVMHKYYKTKLDNIAQRKRDRAASQKRLHGGHTCKIGNINRANQGMTYDDRVELLLRQPDEGIDMHDEEMSAHQFSAKD